ncbi:hypothetical protein M0R45_012015 [Rubus argutus]|uniref:Uncharacterized protein n=1 Tax=Rubus argutus TaxID=59490 RepID=A0AAW1YDD1_RUBAR
MMLRLCYRTRRDCYYLFPHHHRQPRFFSSSASRNPIEPPINLKNANQVPPPPSILQHRSSPLIPIPTASISRNTVLGLSAAIASVAIASYAVVAGIDSDEKSFNPLYDAVQRAAHQSAESCRRIIHHAKQTGVTASVLWHSLRSVLSSANHEVRSGFQLRVAALLADISAANASRRAAIVGAGGGAVVDWLLESVAVPRMGPGLKQTVLGRPRAVPNLLRFIYSCQPKQSKKHSRRSSLDVSDSLRGRSMLVAAIMDIVTSNCDSLEKVSFKPSLPGNAETRDIAAALQVIEEGGMRLDDSNENEDDEDGDSGIKAVVPGLWDDLTCQHVAVPFAAWALANWAMASDENRSLIQELDGDGNAIMTALMAPERSVKWHGSLVARLLLEDDNKASSVKGTTQPNSDKVKTQIDQSNILSATQTANLLVAAVVNLAVKQLGTTTDSVDTSPLADLLSMEPFSPH